MSFITKLSVIITLSILSFTNYALASRWGQDPGHYQIINKFELSNALKFADEPDYHKATGNKYHIKINPYFSYGATDRINFEINPIYSFTNKDSNFDLVAFATRILLLSKKNYDFIFAPKLNITNIGKDGSVVSPELRGEVAYNDEDLFLKAAFALDYRSNLKTHKAEYNALYQIDKIWSIIAIAEEVTNKHEYSRKNELGVIYKFNDSYRVQLGAYNKNVKTYFAQRGTQRGIIFSLWFDH